MLAIVDVFIILALYTMGGFWHALFWYVVYCLARGFIRLLILG